MHRSTRRRRPATKPPAIKMRCRIMRQGDENVCGSCGLRWPVVEDSPQCGDKP